MRKLLIFLLLIPVWCMAQTGSKPDFIRTPNSNYTIVDWNFKAKTFNLPHYLLTARRSSQDSIGTIFLNTNTADPHIYIKRVVGSTYSALAYLSDTTTYNFLKSTYNGINAYNTVTTLANHFGLNILNKSSASGAASFIRTTNNMNYYAQMAAVSSTGVTGSGGLLQPNTVFLEGFSPRVFVGNKDSLGVFGLYAGNGYNTNQPTLLIDSLQRLYFFHLGNSVGVGDSILFISSNGRLRKGQFAGVVSIFGRNGNVVAQTGDYNTSQVTENTNLYFTNARAIGATLTGYSAGAGTITSADNIVQAIGKLQGNITASVTGVSSFNTRTGAITLTAADVNSAAGTLSGWSVPYTLLSGTVPTWNQNTTGTAASAATLTTPRNINGVSFNGSANITITANTTNSLLNGYGVLGGSFNGSSAITLRVDTARGKLVTTYGLLDTINAHGASAGIGINGTLFAAGTVAVDTAGVVVSKGYLAYYVPVKRGSVALVSGTKAITIAGLTTSSMAIVSCKSQGGTTTTTQTYTGACTSNTLTINAVTNAGTNTVNTGDTSTISYTVYQ